MSTKHFLSDPTTLVSGALHSLPILNPAVVLDAEHKVVRYVHPGIQGSTVSIVSGGGSGHEPAFGAYVGAGLLAASVAGTIFASPSSRQIQHCLAAVDSSKGVLVTVMNYTGDILNFGVAVEKTKALMPEKKIEMLVVGDDVAVPRSQAGKVGRRGIAGTVLVHKITGALAAAGYALAEVRKIGQLVSENLVSVGTSLDRVHVPGQDTAEKLSPGEIELGMGIHNEAGSSRRNGQNAQLPALVGEMLRQLLDIADPQRSFLPTWSNKMVLLVNNLGGLSVLELGAITTEILGQLHASYDITTVRVYAGTFMTSLNGPGFSISLLNLVPTGIDMDMIQLLDAPSEATGWNAPVRTATWAQAAVPRTKDTAMQGSSAVAPNSPSNLVYDLPVMIDSFRQGLRAVIEVEPEVTHYDTVVGDGDCGTTLKRGAEALLDLCAQAPTDLVQFLLQVTETVERTMDGTSGALYAIFLNSLTTYFRANPQSSTNVNIQFWTRALGAAAQTLARYTPAQVGDRTLIDALHPFLDTLRGTADLQDAAKMSLAGAENTKVMTAKLGRAVYVGGVEDWVGKIPDPGAWGLSHFFLGLSGLK